jgi:rhodanese-related sulfurtransferase
LLASNGQEIAFLDIREFGEYGTGHPFQSVNAPFSLLEAKVGKLVPRISTFLVVMDSADEGRARRAAQCLAYLGYSNIAWLEGGAAGWQNAGYSLFAGVNVVSKTFGELVHKKLGPEEIGAVQLAEWQRQDRPVYIIDGRPVAEYNKMNIPTSMCCPNGELAKRISTILDGDTETPVVINCAGRTRSIIGAQTLRWLGVQNPVYALENGTQGWRLAGLSLEHGSKRYYPRDARADAAIGSAARQLAESHRVAAIDEPTLNHWLAEEQGTTFVFDIRTDEEYREDGPAGAVHAPGGQLIQAFDHWVGVQSARVVLIDDDECRAPMIASWLALMGVDVAWLRGGRDSWRSLRDFKRQSKSNLRLEIPRKVQLEEALGPAALCLDARPSMQYREGHLPGYRWVSRSLLNEQITSTDYQQSIIIIADMERAICLTIELKAQGFKNIGWLASTLVNWQSKGVTLDRTPDEPNDTRCVDYLSFMHDRHDGNLEASRRYLAWETGLLAQLDDQERSIFKI